MKEARIHCGDWSAPAGDPQILDSFFATLSYRLEPEGVGSRFPILMGQLSAGRLAPQDAVRATQELELAGRELAGLPAAKAIISLEDRRPVDVTALPDAATIRLDELFRTSDGRALLEVLTEGVRLCHQRNTELILETASARGSLRWALGLTVAGLVGTVLTYVFLPNELIDFRRYSGSRGNHGAPLWTLVAVIAAAGLAELAKALSPKLAAFINQRFWTFRLLAAAACIAWWMWWWR